MQNLRTFLNAMPVVAQEGFAERCGTTIGYLRKGLSLGQLFGEKLCVAIERESQGAVTRKDLRPNDYGECWPELVDAQAPAEPAPAPHPPTAADDEDAAPAQPMDLAGQCDNNRRDPGPDTDVGNGPCLQPPDIDGESEEARPPRALGLPAAEADNGQPVPPPPGFSGEDENGTPAAPACQADDSQPLLVLDDEAGKAV